MTTGRRIAANFGWLLGGRGGAALLTLAATILSARALGAEGLGTVVLIHTTALVVRQLCNVKSAEAVIRFGVPLKERGEETEWRNLLAGLFRLDLLTAMLAGATALLLNLAAVRVFGLSAELQNTTWLYALALMFSAAGTGKGALRVLDRYTLLSAQLTLGPAMRLGGVLYAVSVDAPVHWYVMFWALALLVEHVTILAMAWRVLRPDPRVIRAARLRDVLRAHPGLPGFLKIVYWQSNLDVFPRQATTLLVGTWFGVGGAGVFRLARDLAEVVGKPVALLRQAIFPDLSRLWRRDARGFMRLTVKVSLAMLTLGGVFVLAALLVGEPAMVVLAGPEYGAGHTILALLLGAASLDLGGAALRPACYTLGRERSVFAIQLAATAVYLLVFFVVAGPFGLIAAGWAALAASATALTGLTVLVRRAAARPLPAEE